MSTSDGSSHCALAENLISTEVKIDKATYSWTIDNFDFLEAKGDVISSHVFSASTNDKVKWFLKLKPNGETDSKDTISLYLHLSNGSEQRKVFARHSIRVLNNKLKEEVIVSSSSVIEFIAGGTGWGRKDACKKDHDFRTKLLANNVLKVSGEVIFSQESDLIVEHHHCRSTPPLESIKAERDIIETFGMLLETHLLSDVVISVNGKDFPMHKTILAARSEVFAAMFQHDTKENQQNRINIEDMSEEVVGEMLRFIYTGSCEKLDEFAGDLLVAADKYDLPRLKTICSEALCKKLSIENATQNLILADKHNASELKNEVIKFIVAKPAEVYNTAGWKNIRSYPLLLEELFQASFRQ